MSEYVSKTLKHVVGERAKNCCEYCLSQAEFATQSFAIDHISPTSLGGETHLDNLALACAGCNGYKSDKISAVDPVSRATVSLYNPRQHTWNEHFCWDKNYQQMLGLTPVGRATVEFLRLNRQPLKNLRRVLYTSGEHPPG